jgi:AraC-like DNA-binding protein
MNRRSLNATPALEAGIIRRIYDDVILEYGLGYNVGEVSDDLATGPTATHHHLKARLISAMMRLIQRLDIAPTFWSRRYKPEWR